MSTLLYRIGVCAGRHPWRVVALWLVAVLSAFTLSSAVGGETNESFRLPGADSQRAADMLIERFPQQPLYTSNVIFHAEKGLSSPQKQRAVAAAISQLAQGQHVVSVTDPFDPAGSTMSENGTTAFATVGYDQELTTQEMFEEADAAAAHAREAGIQVEFAGALGYAKGDAGGGSEMTGILVAIVVLAIAFGSLVAMSLPIGVTLLAILMGTSILTTVAGFTAVPEIATIVGLMLGLGVGIDYALFILSRHRQHLEAGMPVPEAIGRANATAGLSVLFAGVTVMLAIIGVQVSGIPMLAMMGWGAAIMVAVTMLAAITLLPAMLGVVKGRVNSLRVPFLRARSTDPEHTWSARWAHKVIRRPAVYGIAGALFLAILAVPVLSMRLGFADAGNDAPSMTTRKAYDLVANAYGPGHNGPLLVVLDGEPGAASGPVAASVAEVISREPGVASVSPPVINDAGDLAVISVTPTTAPQDEETSDLLAHLREDTLPGAVTGTDVEPFVTGTTAITDDVSHQLQQRMPLFLFAVIGLSFVVLMLVFRSLLVPLKAAALNLLGVAASYGVVVAVFQWGWAASLIGVEEALPITPLAPMLMFAILFGLSMDYEVFLLSRVREQFLSHGDARRAVLQGVGATGRVITSAAVIMIAVFGSFVMTPDPSTKIFGVGLSVAVLLDVTVVRMVLVPAAMSLLGARAWWLPPWLDRLLPAIEIEGGPHSEPASAAEPLLGTDSRQERETVVAGR